MRGSTVRESKVRIDLDHDPDQFGGQFGHQFGRQFGLHLQIGHQTAGAIVDVAIVDVAIEEFFCRGTTTV